MTDRGEMWVWPIPSDGSPVPDYPPALLGYIDGDGLTVCGAVNTPLGLRCNRPPHPTGTAHYQDDGNAVRAWRGGPE